MGLGLVTLASGASAMQTEVQSTHPLRARVIGALAFVGAIVVVTSTGLVSDDVAVIIDDSAQLGAGLAATVACLATARHSQGPERTWRRRMGLGMAGWSVGMSFWAWYQIVADTPMPSPSWADVGFLVMPALALPALLSLAVGHRPDSRPDPHRSIVFFLDGIVVVGALFLLTWATSLGAVVHSVAPILYGREVRRYPDLFEKHVALRTRLPPDPVGYAADGVGERVITSDALPGRCIEDTPPRV